MDKIKKISIVALSFLFALSLLLFVACESEKGGIVDNSTAQSEEVSSSDGGSFNVDSSSTEGGQSAEQSSSIDEQSSSLDEQSSSEDEQSSSVDEQSSSEDEQSSSVDEQSSSEDEQSSSEDEQSSSSGGGGGQIGENTVTVHFDSGTSDVIVEEQTVGSGETVTAPVVSREGYLLRRWTYQGAPFDFGSPVTNSITLTAEWLERTNLPTMSIELFNEDGSTFNITNITREAYVNSLITLCNEDGDLELDNYVSGTKGRGNGSWTESNGGRGKCGLKLKLDKKESLFGRTKNKHWVLLACINFNDVTMSRNYTAFNMAGELFDGIEYTTNVVWVDLYVNGEYRGVYDLCEHVRVGKGRVDIESEYGVLDTGYLIEYDAYAPDGGTTKGVDYFSINDSDGMVNKGGSRSDLVKYGFTIQSPSPEDYATEGNITEEQYRAQVSFIQDYVKRTYSSIIKDKNFTAFSELADADSFVDMYILQELYKNKDCGFSSFFLYKKPGGKLYAGPAWDFDGSTNAESRSADGIFIADGSRNSYSYWNGSSELFVSLYANEQFKALVVDRWKTLSPQISEYYNDLFTEEFYSTYGDAMAKNFCRWKSGASVSSERANWISKTETLFTWFKNRISWLNNEWK